jgi:hypothetical protein
MELICVMQMQGLDANSVRRVDGNVIELRHPPKVA